MLNFFMRSSLKKIIVLGLTAILVISPTGTAFTAEKLAMPGIAIPGVPGKDYIPGEIIVKFRNGSSTKGIHNLANAAFVKNLKVKNTQLVKTDGVLGMERALEVYRNDPAVVYAEPNHIVRPLYTPDDTYLNNQWAAEKMQLAQAWDISRGSGTVKIAVVDTGVDTDHEDLADNLLPGYNTLDANTDSDDDVGHGTHVAGIAAAVTGNGTGVAGVAGECRILPVKALGPIYGTDQSVAEAIIWAADQIVPGTRMVINMSLQSSGPSKIMEEAIKYAHNKGAVIVAAAGNSAQEGNPVIYPAAFENVIAVGATRSDDKVASFSERGNYVDVAAPGVHIYSTTPNHWVWLSIARDYDYMDGTSMAAPQVAGLAALLLSQNPGLTPSQVEYIMEATADKDPARQGFDDEYGYGRINPYRALNIDLDNNTFASASQANPGTSVVARFEGAGDEDWFRYNVSGTRFKATLVSPSGIDGRLQIYDSENTLIKTVNSTGTGGTETAICDVSPGSYYIRITEAAGRSGQSFYNLAVKDSNELNNSFLDAPQISPSATIEENIFPRNDVDIFKFKLVQGGRLTATLQSADQVMDGRLQLYSGQQKEIVNVNNGGIGGVDTLSRMLPPGTYYLKVSNRITQYPCTDQYSLSLNLTPDTSKPTGRVAINNGATFAVSPNVRLNLSASDNSGSVSTVEVSANGSDWDSPDPYQSTMTWRLPPGDGRKKVYVRFDDGAGNKVVASDTIFLDSRKPSVSLNVPTYCTSTTFRVSFPVSWRANDAAPSSGVTTYDVSFREGGSSVWQPWLVQTTSRSALFTLAAPGKTYYFRVLARDRAGNNGWSKIYRVIVPFDNNSLIKANRGFSSVAEGSSYYRGTVRYSTSAQSYITYRFYGTSVALIGTKGPGFSKAKIYIDGKYRKTVNPIASGNRYRQVLYSITGLRPGYHTIKIVNRGTQGRTRFDIDGLAVGR